MKPRVAFIAIAALAVIAGPVLAQCPGGQCSSVQVDAGWTQSSEAAAWTPPEVSLGTAMQSCPSGQCPVAVRGEPRPAEVQVAVNTPTPAWRYAQPSGHRRAVVHIRTKDRDGASSGGSGVLVRYGRRVVVLTARHVIKDAVRVWVRTVRGRWYQARVVKVDARWDCAALDCGQIDGVDPAELETTDRSFLQKDARLESCGYGGDDRLAVNSGRLVSLGMPDRNGPPDWIVISGHGREGDSGGPIFTEKGTVAAVLWGGDGNTISGTQAGRLAVFLSDIPESEMAVRRLVPVPPPPERTSVQVAVGQPRQPCLPIFRPRPQPQQQVVVQPDPEARGALQRIDSKMDTVIANTAPLPQAAAADRHVNPLLGGLIMLAAVALGFVAYFGSQKD